MADFVAGQHCEIPQLCLKFGEHVISNSGLVVWNSTTGNPRTDRHQGVQGET
jgi:hypothetical protein